MAQQADSKAKTGHQLVLVLCDGVRNLDGIDLENVTAQHDLTPISLLRSDFETCPLTFTREHPSSTDVDSSSKDKEMDRYGSKGEDGRTEAAIASLRRADPKGRSTSLGHSLASNSKVVSRAHATLAWSTEGKLTIKDLGSTHGTVVTRASDAQQSATSPLVSRTCKPHEYVDILDGDVITLGKAVYKGSTFHRPLKCLVRILDKEEMWSPSEENESQHRYTCIEDDEDMSDDGEQDDVIVDEVRSSPSSSKVNRKPFSTFSAPLPPPSQEIVVDPVGGNMTVIQISDEEDNEPDDDNDDLDKDDSEDEDDEAADKKDIFQAKSQTLDVSSEGANSHRSSIEKGSPSCTVEQPSAKKESTVSVISSLNTLGKTKEAEDKAASLEQVDPEEETNEGRQEQLESTSLLSEIARLRAEEDKYDDEEDEDYDDDEADDYDDDEADNYDEEMDDDFEDDKEDGFEDEDLEDYGDSLCAIGSDDDMYPKWSYDCMYDDDDMIYDNFDDMYGEGSMYDEYGEDLATMYGDYDYPEVFETNPFVRKFMRKVERRAERAYERDVLKKKEAREASLHRQAHLPSSSSSSSSSRSSSVPSLGDAKNAESVLTTPTTSPKKKAMGANDCEAEASPVSVVSNSNGPISRKRSIDQVEEDDVTDATETVSVTVSAEAEKEQDEPILPVAAPQSATTIIATPPSPRPAKRANTIAFGAICAAFGVVTGAVGTIVGLSQFAVGD